MQRKLKLDLDALQVESFDTTVADHRHEGTVFGQGCTCYTNCTCPGCPTCDASCGGTCAASCNGTCDASCNGTCGEYTYCGCYPGTQYDATCNNYGTCDGNYWGGCPIVP
jgi:hypothetical protein